MLAKYLRKKLHWDEEGFTEEEARKVDNAWIIAIGITTGLTGSLVLLLVMVVHYFM
jgi:hypothetical protein